MIKIVVCDRCRALARERKNLDMAGKLWESQRAKRGAYLSWCEEKYTKCVQDLDILEHMPCECSEEAVPSIFDGLAGTPVR